MTGKNFYPRKDKNGNYMTCENCVHFDDRELEMDKSCDEGDDNELGFCVRNAPRGYTVFGKYGSLSNPERRVVHFPMLSRYSTCSEFTLRPAKFLQPKED